MTESAYERNVMADAAMASIPPLIRKTLLHDQRFREEYSFKIEANIAFGLTGVSMQRSVLFNAVRTVLDGACSAELKDIVDQAWTLTSEAQEGVLPNLVISSGQQRIVLPDYSVLSRDASIRICSLENFVSEVNLPLSDQEKWRGILIERALQEDEVDTFFSDIRDTPAHAERTIRSEITSGNSNISTLVPNSRRYFERLVGVYDGSGSILHYAGGKCREVFRQLSDWRPYEGFLFSLFLSSHSALTAEISTDQLDENELKKAFSFLKDHGDILSRLGAIEVGLRILNDRPEVKPFLLQLVHSIRDDNVESDVSEFKLFSSLFILIDGELARIRLFSGQPPFYRRLASMAQSALIHRQLVECDIDYEHFSEWAINARGEHYYMQTFADMRVEPRWNPNLVDATQMQADFFGRLMIAGNSFQENLEEGELRDTILSNEDFSLIKHCDFPRQYLSGPLEGAEDCPNALPDDLSCTIEEQLGRDEVEAASFIALVNSAMIFRISSNHAELAAKALRLGNYSLSNLENKSQAVEILNGLATVAAVSRSPALADELRILLRRYRNDSEYGFSIHHAIGICLVASASREDLMEWRQFVGECLTELAFSGLEGNEGELLHSRLLTLLHSEPGLWVSCAKADAALQAWCSR